MQPITDSSSDRTDEGMTTLDALAKTPRTDLTQGFDPERLLLGEHGGVVVIVGLLLLALVLLTVAFGALPH